MISTTLPPLITPYLLGHHCELRLRDGTIERGVVVRMTFASPRSITLTHERAEDYRASLGCWLPPRPRAEWVRQHDEIEQITVVDVNEMKNPELPL